MYLCPINLITVRNYEFTERALSTEWEVPTD